MQGIGAHAWRRRCLLWVLSVGLLGALPLSAWAQTFTQITNSTLGGNFDPSINADGTRIAFNSDRDLTGSNADGNCELFLWTSGSGFTQITNTTGGCNEVPSINSDGTRIAFETDRDLTPGSPGNVDGNVEIFLTGNTSDPPAGIPTLSE